MEKVVHILRTRVWAQRLTLFFCGVLAALPLLAPMLWPFALVSLAPLVFFALKSNDTKAVFFAGWCFGAGYMAISWSWIFSTLPLAWLGISSPSLGFFAAFLVWLILSVVLGVMHGLYALTLRRLRAQPLYVIFTLGTALLPLIEWLRAILFSLLAWGPGFSIDANLSLGALGYALTPSSLLWGATLGGVAALSALAAGTSIATVFAVRSRRLAWLLVPACLLILGVIAPAAASVTLGASSTDVDGVSIALLHENLTPSLRWEESEARIRETDLAQKFLVASQEATVVVFPEDARFFSSLSLLEPDMQSAVSRTLARGVYTIESARTDTASGAYGVITVREGNRVIRETKKAYLVPFGEHIPVIVRLVLSPLGLTRALDTLVAERSSYVPGTFDATQRVVEIAGVSFGITACSETFSPSIYRAIGASEAEAFINLASHVWIQDGRPLLFNQMLAMARVDAVFSGIPYLQASAGAPTVVIVPVNAHVLVEKAE